jgi:hypothetical protein
MPIWGEPRPWDFGVACYDPMWQCGLCMEWMPYGQFHACQQMQVTATGIDLTAEDRIASALERIASALERNTLET